MLNNLKALIVILALAGAVFVLVRPLCLRFMSAEDFARRRNVWLALTIVAFLSPTFWLYALVALPLLYWAGSRDDNPLALFVLTTFAIPNIRFYLPGILVNQLFDLTQYRILSLVVLVPAILRMWRQPWDWGSPRLKTTDVLLLAFLLLQIVVMIPYESTTTTMRRTFLFAIDTFAVFYAFSRITSRERLVDVMTCFWVACAIMAPIAIFESLKGWLLYTGLAERWGDPNIFATLYRGESLRAQASSGHSINLGFHLAMAMGVYLFLRVRRMSAAVDALVILVLSMGIIVSYSRGAWVTVAAVFLLFVCMRPNASRHLASSLLIVGAAVLLMYLTPLKESVLDRLPFIGTADQDTIEYRQRLAETSWLLIKQHPFFGDPFVYEQMESLRQGQGIIDIVNGYVYTALFTGFIGLSLLLGIFALPLAKGFKAFFRSRRDDAEVGLVGAALLACLVGALLFIATAGYGTTTYILCGLLLSYAAIVPGRRQQADSSVPTAGRMQPRSAP